MSLSQYISAVAFLSRHPLMRVRCAMEFYSKLLSPYNVLCCLSCTEIKYEYHAEFGYSFYIYSSIHDHTDSHCFMKILQGNLKETLFEWPEKKGNGEMIKKSERVLRDNQCAYINGKILSLF